MQKNKKASLTLSALGKIPELAKKKQASFSSMFKNIPNINEASLSDSRPLLKINMQRSWACYDSQTYLAWHAPSPLVGSILLGGRGVILLGGGGGGM